MTTYKLPEWLGGHECSLHEHDEVREVSVVDLREPDGTWTFRLTVPHRLLTEVVPPLPPEPDALAVKVRDHVFVVDVAGGQLVDLCPGPCHDPLDWRELCALAEEWDAPIVPLVPDPVASAPELPFEVKDFDLDYARVSVHEGKVAISAPTSAHLEPDDAEQFAAAVLRAAREARKAGGES